MCDHRPDPRAPLSEMPDCTQETIIDFLLIIYTYIYLNFEIAMQI